MTCLTVGEEEEEAEALPPLPAAAVPLVEVEEDGTPFLLLPALPNLLYELLIAAYNCTVLHTLTQLLQMQGASMSQAKTSTDKRC